MIISIMTKRALMFATSAGGIVAATSGTPGIRCVQCISESSRACIDTPPAPRPCDAAARYCIVVRESLLHNGERHAILL